MRKLLLKTFILTALAMSLLTLTAAAAQIGTGVVHTDGLRLRKEPNTECEIVTNFQDGTTLQIYEKLDGWYKVSWQNYEGYVSSEYVSFTPVEAKEEVPAGEPAGTEATINGSSVNFRTGPSTDAQIILSFSQGAKVSVLSQENGWCQVRYKGQTGYVSADYVSVGGMALANPRGIITGSCVNIRTQPSTNGGVVAQAYAGELVDLLSIENGWYTVSYKGVTGYASADYVREYTGSTASANGEQVAATALGYLGVPYVYGGSSEKGFDCSGFTMHVMSLFGHSLAHSATGQWNGAGTVIERSDLQPGDLVFFCDPSRSKGKACSHVGIYVGNDEFVHASSGSRSGKKVRINSLTEDYYNRYYKGAKRLA